MDAEIERAYVQACEPGSDIWEYVPRFANTVIELEAKTVIELGVRTGVSTAGWLWGLEHTDGELWSVDIGPHKAQLFAERWHFIQGNDLDPDVAAQLPAVADIVFIDTSHTYDQTLGELALYVPRVRKGGRVFLHDTELERPESIGRDDEPFPVRRAIDMYCMANGLDWTDHSGCYGLGEIHL